MDTDKKTALVTGASSGFGRELVKLFARDGYNVILVARTESELHAVAQQLESEFADCQTLVIPKICRNPRPRKNSTTRCSSTAGRCTPW